MSGLLKLHFFKSAVVASALALAGCAAVPPVVPGSPSPSQNASVKAKSAPVAAQPVDAANESSAVSPSIGTPQIDSPQPPVSLGSAERELERGGASWYGPGFHGKRTASGERYDMGALTAAHKTLPFGTMVRVKSLVNGREVLVRITDRGPFIRNRVIDLSRAAASELDMLGLGFKQVVLMVVEGEVVSKPFSVAKRRRGR